MLRIDRIIRAGLTVLAGATLAGCATQGADQPAALDSATQLQAGLRIQPVVENYVPAAQAGVVTQCVIATAPAADLTELASMTGAASPTQTQRILDLIGAPAATDCIAKQLL